MRSVANRCVTGAQDHKFVNRGSIYEWYWLFSLTFGAICPAWTGLRTDRLPERICRKTRERGSKIGCAPFSTVRRRIYP